MEWWRSQEAMPTRDYFRVEDEAGLRFWLYRDGLYGEIVQEGTPREIYASPRQAFVANFVGRINFLEARVVPRRGEDPFVTLETSIGELRCPALLLWPTRDPYIPEKFGPAYAAALGGPAELELVEAGHWSWLDRPELIERAAAFLG